MSAFTSAPAWKAASSKSILCSSQCCSRRIVVRASVGAPLPRRAIVQGFASLCLSLPMLAGGHVQAEDVEEQQESFAEYRGPLSLGFSFRYPADWKVKKKPIKTHLSEVIVSSKTAASTSVGLIVDQVKINSIDKIGSPQEVGNKVVNLELNKDGVTSAELLASSSEDRNGLTYYRVDYVVDSSRGAKHYMAKATITAQQLYVFTAQSKVADFDGDTETTLEQIVQSFDVKPQYI